MHLPQHAYGISPAAFPTSVEGLTHCSTQLINPTRLLLDGRLITKHVVIQGALRFGAICRVPQKESTEIRDLSSVTGRADGIHVGP